MKKEIRMISKDGIIFEFPGYTSSKEKEEEEDEEEKEEEERKSKRKGSKKASEIGSNSESSEMALKRQSNSGNDENLDIVAIIAQQMQNIIPQIVTQVTNNMNNNNKNNNDNNANNWNGNNGCSYKTFLACNPRDYDGKGGMIALTRWIEKMEYVIDNSGSSRTNKRRSMQAMFVLNRGLDVGGKHSGFETRVPEDATRNDRFEFKGFACGRFFVQ
ncbi:hypothetical protein Tco_0802745 [Tanacetum coccineum]|uniref:Reverse transcriptase domain-containing protein n=1 Tax=Tanacetum coccineum TaxID=301880 RepID=A0ABQ5A0K7_9ASTR